MPHYVTLYKFTEQGVHGLKESPQRLRAGIEAAERAGMKVITALYTQGQYDLIVVSEAPSDEAAISFNLSIALQGNVRPETMRAYTAEEFASLLNR